MFGFSEQRRVSGTGEPMESNSKLDELTSPACHPIGNYVLFVCMGSMYVKIHTLPCICLCIGLFIIDLYQNIHTIQYKSNL